MLGLDSFLRPIWLECCGLLIPKHPSKVTIECRHVFGIAEGIVLARAGFGITNLGQSHSYGRFNTKLD
ncbi:MAG TPA: hypothetical protein VH796_01325 [Nitrososphaeraceae archaeon]